ncbi:VIT domain-containing protein [Sphaerisporangium sp. TRM90804]|uniref:VIT domain-containing protein n=1 Tax=Sphaerisporangium sp. TRM90804 TaxID=3031113 RepID=UPI002447AE09|nr:VIT domain-containing protein [Sphaerisporangium sp. TRM90804]MDH2424532.1 VIT domain-containing protein [Sphaerisporangium sp. TRM90804]
MSVQITSLKPGEYTPLPDAGLGALRTGRGNLPLESVDVNARITGLVSGVEVAQGFRNPYDVPLEATYVFPLPDRAAVTAFRMEADDRVVEGVLKERGQARRDYDQALSEGRRAAIAEEDRPDVFTIRVGNIVPGERVTVRLTLSQPLPYEDGAATFRFPLVVAPRYIPGNPLDDASSGDGVVPDTDAVPDASRITPPVLLPGFPNPVRLSLAVAVDPAGLDLAEMRSSLHVVTREDGVVRLQPGERLDRDFILRLGFTASSSLALIPDHAPSHADGETTGAPEDDTRTTTASDTQAGAGSDGDGTFTLTVLPPAPDEPAARRPRDVVLLLDRSGSMTGWKMVAARRAAARIVDTLTSGDRFAVLAFDSVVERPQNLDAGLVPATDRNRYRAVEHLARLDARGGTEMLDPLEQALALLDDATRERVLVLVTDGQVGNEDQILERLGTRLASVRVHTVGVDRAVNAGFLGRLAGLGSGRCELVESEDRLDEAMEHIHRRIGSPLVTGLTLKADGLDVLPGTVTHLGSLYPGVPLTVSGRFRGPARGALAVHGLDAAGQPWERRLDGTRADDQSARAIWARAHLRRLEDRYVIGEHDLEERIVATSLRHGVLCRFTAFVAVDTRVVTDGGHRHRVVQPVETPSGWEAPAEASPLMATPVAYTTAATPAVFSMARRQTSAQGAPPSPNPKPARPASPGAPTWPTPPTPAGPSPDAPIEPHGPLIPGPGDPSPDDPNSPFPPGTPGRPYTPAPGEPGGPHTPGDPNDPYTPSDPNDPYTPGWPGDPSGPYAPGGPADPGGPYTPGRPGDPGGPYTPGGPADPGGPYTPGGPGDPNGPYTPGGPGEPGGPYAPGGPEGPSWPGPLPKIGSSRGRMVIRPVAPGAAPPGLVPHSLDAARPQLLEELARLRDLRSLPEDERRGYLADLASRVAALAAFLGGDGRLTALAGELAACELPGAPVDVDALWQRATTVLAELVGAPESPTTPAEDQPTDPPPSRRPFWKRS